MLLPHGRASRRLSPFHTFFMQRVTQERKAQREAQREAQQKAKDMKKAQREAQQKAKDTKKAQREARERAREAAEEPDEEDQGDGDEGSDAADDVGEDRLPEDVLAALSRRDGRNRGGHEEDVDDEEEDQRAVQRRIVSQQLRALAKPSNKRKKFAEGRTFASGIVVKSLKSSLATERQRGAAASRNFLEGRLGRHARDHSGIGIGMRTLPDRRKY